MNSSRLSVFCERALEAGWLLGVTITPVFFNVYSSRVFEPDKLTTLRSLAVVMAILWLVRFFDGLLRGEKSLSISWRTPMVLPALLTMGIYLLSSAFSVVPYTSMVGSYQRLQGTFSLFGYLVLFFAILTTLRTRAQLSRLLTVLIINSLPISLYGIVQKKGLDPLPWAGNVQTRVASNMGNAIFVAAYLIMIVPLTAARIIESFTDILTRKESRLSDILAASAYIFILAVQLLTIFYSQSRGPWLGLVAAGFLLPYLALMMLQRQAIHGAVPDADAEAPGWMSYVLKGAGLGVGSLALVGLFAFLGSLTLGNQGMLIGGLVGGLAFAGLWLYMIVERRGWRWLWIGWGMVGLALALVLIAINVDGPIHEAVLKVPTLRRLALITQLESGTGKVRVLIWEGAMEMILPHEPINFPDDTVDRFNALRPLVGYGPESMYVAYNSFYPPLLGHYESRTASPDRSHNETLDSIVITGLLGLGVYLFTFGSVFYWGFKWLGLLTTRRQFWTYVGLNVLCSAVFFVIGWQLEGLYLFAIAIPLGMLAGTMLYLTLEAFLTLVKSSSDAHIDDGSEEVREALPALHPHTILIVAILAAVIAHFVEINFGIAIASTRTTFWAITALMVVLGLNWVPALNAETAAVPFEASESAREVSAERSPARRRRGPVTSSASHSMGIPPWLAAVLALSMLTVFLIGTLSFDFINNPKQLKISSDIFWKSLTLRYEGGNPVQSLGALMIFGFTWFIFGVVGLAEYDREEIFSRGSRSSKVQTAVIVFTILTFLGFLFVGLFVAGYQAGLANTQPTSIAELVEISMSLAGLLSRYYLLIFFMLVAIGLLLMGEERLPVTWGHPMSLLILVVLLFGGAYLIRTLNYDLIRADIIFKQGSVYANSSNVQEKEIGVLHFEKALEYVPGEDYYHLFLGKAYLEWAQALPDAAAREEKFEETEAILLEAREINPLNTDHSANLGRFYKSWAARVQNDIAQGSPSEGERAELEAKRDELLRKSEQNYRVALMLSPQNPILWNELAQLYALDFQDMVKFQETISRSQEVDPEFETTWMLIGDMRSSTGDVAGAITAYETALDVKYNCTVARVLGTLEAQQELWPDAVETLEAAVAVPACTKSGELWEMYRVLAISYANNGDNVASIEAAQTALELAPENQRPAIQSLLDTLRAQGQSVPSEPQP